MRKRNLFNGLWCGTPVALVVDMFTSLLALLPTLVAIAVFVATLRLQGAKAR